MAHISPLLKPAKLQPRNFDHIVDLPGFNQDMMRVHLELYSGYIDATNALMETLSNGRVPASAARELQRRLGWEYNGVRLHEAFFGALSADPAPGPNGNVAPVIERSYGDIDTWWTSFSDIAKSRGSGWAVLTYDPDTDSVLNTWIDEHDVGILAGTVPLFVVDLFEHAYLRQFRTDRTSYLEAVRASLDWHVVDQRLIRARAP